MTISILLCTYNRPQLLNPCLDSIIDKSSELPDELIIVNGGDSAADLVIEHWQKKFKGIKLIRTKNINLAISRNIGLPHCSGDIIALTDDDVNISPDWIKKVKELHKEHPEAGGIGGLVKSIGNRFIDKIADLVIFPSQDRPCYTRTIPGANASYKRETINKVGEYDVSLFRGEDVDYNWRILKTGYNIYYDPGLVVYHNHRSTWAGFFYQVFMYGRAYCRVRSKWPDMYCVYPHRLKSAKDISRLGYFIFGIFFESLNSMKKIQGFFHKIAGFFVLVFTHLMWRCGMLVEKMRFVIRNQRVERRLSC